MKITPKAIDFTIHRVLSGQQVTRGCSLPLRELMRLWAETTLRRGDLIAGLKRLEAARHLAIEPAPEGPKVRLLDESFGLITTHEDRAAVAALDTLRAMRQRPGAHLHKLLPSTATARRKNDTPVAA